MFRIRCTPTAMAKEPPPPLETRALKDCKLQFCNYMQLHSPLSPCRPRPRLSISTRWSPSSLRRCRTSRRRQVSDLFREDCPNSGTSTTHERGEVVFNNSKQSVEVDVLQRNKQRHSAFHRHRIYVSTLLLNLSGVKYLLKRPKMR